MLSRHLRRNRVARWAAHWLVCWLMVCLAGWHLASPVYAAPGSPWLALADTVFKHLSVEQGLPPTSVTALLEDADGFIWIGTQGGLARWDGYRFRVYQPNPGDPASLPDNFISSMALDQQGRVWIGTNSGGLDHYFPDSGRVVHFRHKPDDPRSLPGNNVRNLLRDHQGRLWVGTNEGLAYVMDKSVAKSVAQNAGQDGQFVRVRIAVVPQPAISKMVQGRDGTIWLGISGNGVFYIKPFNSTAPGAQPEPQRLSLSQGSSAQDTIESILEVAPGEIWFGTLGQGLLILNNTARQLRRLNHDPSLATSLAANSVGAILRDRSGLIWLGTHRGISLYDPTQAAVLSVFGNPNRPNSIGDTDVTAMSLMPDGKLWLGLLGQGINIIDPVADQVTRLRADPKSAKLVVSFKAIAVGSEHELIVALPLQAWLRDLITLLCAPLEAAGVKLALEVRADLTLHIACAALTEALTRIINNVHDHAFAPPCATRAPALTITAQQEADGGVVLTVRDNGVGIAPQHLPWVFEPFFTTKSGLGGHIGLGLYVA